MTTKPVRTRFAPSPTGFLHIGGVRAALFNYLYAKSKGGTFVLRLEDTDRERFVPKGVEQIVEVLKWLQIVPDEGFWEGAHSGDFKPYIQSERLPHYRQWVDQLLESGLAYRSTISSADFETAKQSSIAQKLPFVYRRTMEPPTGDELDTTIDRPIRLDMKAVSQKLGLDEVVWSDEVRGEFTVRHDIIDDFILIKADGFPTYNFANIIDDHMMKISHVLRGDEFISSTPKHALLYDILDLERPVWAHLPVILGDDGAKLSKRHGDTDALQYREKGFLPEVMLNFLALLGWNDGTEKEIFSIDEMMASFSLDRVQKSPAKFDLERLKWLNGIYIREQLSEADYIEKAFQVLAMADMPQDDRAKQAVLLERDRVKLLSDLPEMIGFFFTVPDLMSTTALATKKIARLTVKSYVEWAIDALESCDETEVAVEKELRAVVERENIKVGDFFSTIRIVITGRTAAPGLFETIICLSLKETLSRLRNLNSQIN
ncbi:MAG: glutamate--tRNA ligase [bacterium]